MTDLLNYYSIRQLPSKTVQNLNRLVILSSPNRKRPVIFDMASKTIRPPKTITARLINLVDSEGKMRIVLDAGGSDSFASICLFDRVGGAIQICSQPNGALVIGIAKKRSQAVFALGPKGDSLLSLTDRKGRLGARIESSSKSGEHNVLLFKKGQICWSALRSKPAKRVAR